MISGVFSEIQIATVALVDPVVDDCGCSGGTGERRLQGLSVFPGIQQEPSRFVP